MDTLYIAYFLIHFITTVLVDAAIAIPPKYQLPIQKYLLKMHMDMNNDVLIKTKPAWLQAFIWVEILLQAPFFLWAAHDLYFKRQRINVFVVIYGVEAATTTLACLAEILISSAGNKLSLMLLYMPYLVIPLMLVIDFSRRILKVKAKIE